MLKFNPSVYHGKNHENILIACFVVKQGDDDKSGEKKARKKKKKPKAQGNVKIIDEEEGCEGLALGVYASNLFCKLPSLKGCTQCTAQGNQRCSVIRPFVRSNLDLTPCSFCGGNSQGKRRAAHVG